MREDDGRKLDHHTLEVLRLRAVDQVARGVPAAEVGAGLTAVGIHPKTIYTWLAKARAGGRQALLSRSAPGPRRKLSAQRPLYRAEQADSAAVARWKQVEYPRIAAAAKTTGGTVYFVDEAGVRSDYHAGTTWAPVAQTPAVRSTGARFGLNMISAISARGALRFSVLAGTLTGARFIGFLQRLIPDAQRAGAGPVFVIVDGHPVHRATAVDRF